MPTVPNARILLDSVSPEGVRLTTFQITMHRFVLAEFNTHRVFSRNSASSRAIPYKKMRQRILDDPAMPVHWGREMKGMQSGEEISDTRLAGLEWRLARNEAVRQADRLHQLNVHKSIINRLLEPFMWQTVIATATDLDGFFEQRCHEDAQPEIKLAADAMFKAYTESTPNELYYGEWHRPLVYDEDYDWAIDQVWSRKDCVPGELLRQISVARCARVSYLTMHGVRDHSEDLRLYDRLTTHKPMHASPLEHVATPGVPKRGNFRGWIQMREIVEDEC